MTDKNIWLARAFALMAILLTATVALTLRAGSAAAQDHPYDTLVMGTVIGATGGTVSVFSDATVCTTIAGGTIASDGTYQIVVNCPKGTGTLYVNGDATSVTFPLIPGTVSSGVNATIGGGSSTTPTTPNATATATAVPGATTTAIAGTTAATTGTRTGTAGAPSPPKSDNTRSPSGSSHAWIFVIAAVVVVIALGAGGVVAVRMRRQRSSRTVEVEKAPDGDSPLP